MTQRHECGGTYIGVSECTRREEYDGIGGGSKWGVSIYDGVGSPQEKILIQLCQGAVSAWCINKPWIVDSVPDHMIVVAFQST